MNIIFQPGFDEYTGARLITMAISLKQRLGEYVQEAMNEEFINTLGRTLFIPMLRFNPIPVKIAKGKLLACYVRYAVSSTYTDETKPILHHIHEHRLMGKVDWITAIPRNVLHAALDTDEIETLQDLLDSVIDPEAASVGYFYSESECERITTYSLAVVNRYGTPDKIHCQTTTYFSIRSD